MSLTYKYKDTERPDGTLSRVPSIPVLWRGPKGQTLFLTAIIDSGADVSAMSQEMADILGLEYDTGTSEEAFGLGGTVKSVDSAVEVTLESRHERDTFRMPVKIILGTYQFPPLLGRFGFFSRYRIEFNQRDEKVTLKKQSS